MPPPPGRHPAVADHNRHYELSKEYHAAMCIPALTPAPRRSAAVIDGRPEPVRVPLAGRC